MSKRKNLPMRLIIILLIALACGSTALYVQYSIAATQGTLGVSSQGDATLSMDIPQLVRISGIQDINFGNFSGGADLSQDVDVCVYTNLDGGEYRVRASGSGVDNAFDLERDGTGQEVPYVVYWSDTIGTAGDQIALLTGQASVVQDGANTASQNCGGGASANFEVRMTANNLLNVPAGQYSGVLTLTILPES